MRRQLRSVQQRDASVFALNCFACDVLDMEFECDTVEQSAAVRLDERARADRAVKMSGGKIDHERPLQFARARQIFSGRQNHRAARRVFHSRRERRVVMAPDEENFIRLSFQIPVTL